MLILELNSLSTLVRNPLWTNCSLVESMELKDKEVIKRGITVNSPSSDYEPTLGGLTCM